MTVDEALLRTLTHAVQEALIEAMRVGPDDQPRDPKGWLVTVAWRKFLDATRAETSRRQREVRVEDEPVPGPVEGVATVLRVLYLVLNEGLIRRRRPRRRGDPAHSPAGWQDQP